MITNSGAMIAESDLIATFEFGSVVCPIGKFDPDEYPEAVFPDVPWNHLGTEVMQQLSDSKMFTQNQLETLAFMAPETFLACIVEK